MNALIGDIGNTVTKVCLIEINTLKIKKIIHFNSVSISSRNYLKKKFKKIIKNKSINKIALFSSVVPKYQLTLRKFLKSAYKIKLKEIKEKGIKKIVKINIKNKNQVGSDRIANAVGVFKRYKSNCIVLDFGTATTFDVVTKNGIYNGGIIAPGINLSLKSLIYSADQIPIFSIKKQKKIIGKNTLEALRSGFYWGYTGLINNIALFSSVVPKYQLTLRKFLKRVYKIKLIEIKEKGIKKIVKINIKNKNQVGSDRIANAVGVYKRYKSNCIVLDFGTATTFDVVTKNGIYNGGIIAPGINLSLKSLIYSADQIPIFSIKKQKKIIGKNTIEALRSGFYWGYAGLINNIIKKIEKETKKKYKIIFTGGYANLFKTSIIRPFKIDKNITINGIIEIFRENKKYLI